MPPKKRSTKSDPTSDAEAEGGSASPPPAKKSKAKAKEKGPVTPLDPSVPHNKAFPEELEFARPAEGSVRVAMWNVAGIKACLKKGLEKYVEAEDADLVFICETKSVECEIAAVEAKYPHRYWGVDPNKKGYAGVAFFSKHEPIKVEVGLPTLEPQGDSAGRIITLEFANHYVVGVYAPNAGEGLKNMDQKEAWNAAFETYLRQLDATKPVIWTGDVNVVPTENDVRNWKTNYNKSAGCTQIEIDGFNKQLNPEEGSGHKKLVDVWRHLHPDTVGVYSYYSYRFQAREKGIGWRLDSFLLSERVVDKVKQCEIRSNVYGASDHLPIVLDIEGPL